MHYPIPILSFLSCAAMINAYSNTVYLIRHGEKPDDGSNGLSAQGEERAQCLRNVFGPDSDFNIRYVMAEQPKKSGARERPYETVMPVASDLGLAVDTSCDRDDQKCVAKAVSSFAKGHSSNVLIAWEHDALTDIAGALGVKKPPTYPDASFNLIWTVKDGAIVSTTSENCPGLDN